MNNTDSAPLVPGVNAGEIVVRANRSLATIDRLDPATAKRLESYGADLVLKDARPVNADLSAIYDGCKIQLIGTPLFEGEEAPEMDESFEFQAFPAIFCSRDRRGKLISAKFVKIEAVTGRISTFGATI